MFSKGGTKWLLIAVVVLGALYLFSQFGSKAKERNFRSVVMTLDTAAVQSITLSPANSGHTMFKLQRRDAGWKVTSEEREYGAIQTKVHALLANFSELPTKRFAGRDRSNLKQFGLTDSLRNPVTFELNNGETKGVFVGRLTRAPSADPQREGDVWMYVQMQGEEEVFAVPGNPDASAEHGIELWRQSHLVKSDPAGWQRITFNMPNEKYTLERAGDVWVIDGDTANTNSINSFTGALSKASVPRFAPDDVQLADEQRTFRLTIEGNEPEPIDLSVYSVNGRYYAKSSQNPENIIEFDPTRDIPRLFRPRSIFL